MQAARPERPSLRELIGVGGPAFLGFWAGIWAVWAARGAIRRAVWDAEATQGTHDNTYTIRGDLRPSDAWMRTPDERLPGNTLAGKIGGATYFELIAFDGWDKRRIAYHWIGIRNRAHGFMFDRWARPMLAPWPSTPGMYRGYGLWWLRKEILWGRFQFKAGWRNYLVNGKWYGVPCLTITKP